MNLETWAQAQAPGRLHAARQLLLTMVAAPRAEHVRRLNPDPDGVLPYCSRQEAIDRGLSVYTGAVSQLDKPLKVKDAPAHYGGWCSIRFTANGNTQGQLRAHQILNKGNQHAHH